jgi:hypothetical protein
VGDVRNEGLSQESGTAVYFPESRAPREKLNLFVRTHGDPLSTAGGIRRVIHDFEPEQAINDIASLQQVVHNTVAQPRFLSAVLSAFGGTALGVGGRPTKCVDHDLAPCPPADCDRTRSGPCFGDAFGASSRGDAVRCKPLGSHGLGGCRRHTGVSRGIRGPDASPPRNPGGPHRRVEVRI